MVVEHFLAVIVDEHDECWPKRVHQVLVVQESQTDPQRRPVSLLKGLV